MSELLTSPDTCKQKRRFRTSKAARAACKRRNLHEEYKWNRVYRCNVCEQYHLTTRKERGDD